LQVVCDNDLGQLHLTQVDFNLLPNGLTVPLWFF
jgi:hypothetical protein